jgi:hypothetical protein
MRAFERITAAADLLRPRTFFRTLARVGDLADTARELRTQVATLERRTAQLVAIERLQWEQQADLELLAGLDVAVVDTHIRRAIDEAQLELDPFPHIVVSKWLPRDVYDLAVRSIPPSVFFADGEPHRQQLAVPFGFAPIGSRLVWRFMADQVVVGCLRDALAAKFRDLIAEYVRTFCPAMDSPVDLALNASDGRIMLRRPGYVISPHRDPKWGFLTGLMYLARKGDDEAHGTKLYRVAHDEDAPSGHAYYVEPARCELVKAVPFRPNTLLVFLNSSGAHGASIPADAQPASLERYVYQFRLGPPKETIAALLARMDPHARALWAGSKSARADVADVYA